jgi:hypothetical protein
VPGKHDAINDVKNRYVAHVLERRKSEIESLAFHAAGDTLCLELPRPHCPKPTRTRCDG